MIARPIAGRLLAPLLASTVGDPALPWESGGGGAALSAPSISISGTRGGTLTATVTGVPTPSVQWQRAATLGGGGSFSNITGATSSTFDDSGTDPYTAGHDVRCVATNAVNTATSNTLSAYTPLQHPTKLLWWDSNSLSATPVSSWLDRVSAVDAAQGTGANQPAWSATAVSSAYPGVTFDGTADFLQAAGAGAALSGKTNLTLIVAALDTETAVKVALELTANSTTTNGGFSLAPNNTGTNFCAIVRGTAGATARQVATETMAAAAVWSVAFDYATAGANAIPWIRKNGVSQTLANITTASAAGSAANSTLNFGARNGASLFWPGTHAQVFICESIAENAALTMVENYLGASVGLSILENLGRVLTIGDSITRGLNADTGGWRRFVESELLAAGVPWTAVGPFTTGSSGCTQKAHGGLNNDTTADRAATIVAQVTAAMPQVIIWALGVNDIGSAVAPPRVSPAQYITNLTALLDAADGIVPTVQHLIQTIIVPTAGSGLDYLAEYATANASLATLCAGRARCTLVNVGAPTRDDGVHPVDTAGGYPAMGVTLAAALRALP